MGTKGYTLLLLDGEEPSRAFVERFQKDAASIIAGASLLLLPLNGLTFSLTGRYIGVMYGDLANSDLYRNDPYFVADASLSYREKNILGMHYVEFRIEMDNLFDKFYTSYVESGRGFFVAAPRHGFGTLEIGL